MMGLWDTLFNRIRDQEPTPSADRKSAPETEPAPAPEAPAIPKPVAEARPVSNRSGPLFQRGDVIGGRYEVYKQIGRGGFGLVYLIYDRETRDVSALKTLRDEFLADRGARAAFQREARLWVDLDEHPFILSADWVLEYNHRLFVQMEFVPPDARGRTTLRDHLRQAQGPLPTEHVRTWAMQCCLGMEHAAARGIGVHRDLKPSNLLITPEGTLKVADFGLAVVVGSASAGAGAAARGSHGQDARRNESAQGFGLTLIETQGGRVCGTPGYIAPEVIAGRRADVWSDVYSFGVVLWQMLTGQIWSPLGGTPRRGEAPAAYQARVYDLQRRGVELGVEGPLGAVAARCLAADPTARYANFGALRAALEELGGAVDVPDVGRETAFYWTIRGEKLSATFRHEEAVASYDRALDLDPKFAPALNGRGNSLGDLGRSEEALASFDRALEIDLGYASAWSNRAIILANVGRHKEAVASYDRAVEINPSDAAGWYNRGISLAALGRYEDAVVSCDRALNLDPSSAPNWHYRGVCQANLGRFEEALESFEQALQYDPVYTAAWGNRGNSLHTLGRYAEALASYERALALDPSSALNWYNHGGSLRGLGRQEEALASYDRALEIDPDYAMAWTNRGNTLQALGQDEEALVSYERALALDPGRAAAWTNRGNSLTKLGRYEEALTSHVQALEIDPSLAGSWLNKAAIAETLGRTSTALDAYQRFIELAPAHYEAYVAQARQKIATLQRR